MYFMKLLVVCSISVTIHQFINDLKGLDWNSVIYRYSGSS